MAKKIKKSRIHGSRVRPRRDARRMLKQMMKETFRLSDYTHELSERLEAGVVEIENREDVSPELIERMRAVTDGKVDEANAFVIAQDEYAATAEKLLGDVTRPWVDIEDQILSIQLQMHGAIDLAIARQSDLLGAATEIAIDIPDGTPVKIDKIEDAVIVEKEKTVLSVVA